MRERVMAKKSRAAQMCLPQNSKSMKVDRILFKKRVIQVLACVHSVCLV